MATTGFGWTPYQAPAVNMNSNFYQPADSKMVWDPNYAMTLDDAQRQRQVTKFDGGLTREMMGNGFGFLNTNIGEGFTQLSDQLNYGGTYGSGGRGRVFAPTSQNGYGTGWDGNNPFLINSF